MVVVDEKDVKERKGEVEGLFASLLCWLLSGRPRRWNSQIGKRQLAGVFLLDGTPLPDHIEHYIYWSVCSSESVIMCCYVDVGHRVGVEGVALYGDEEKGVGRDDQPKKASRVRVALLLLLMKKNLKSLES